MAVYKRRGQKSKSNNSENEDLNHSTTEEVFENLDTGAYKIEGWVQKNNKIVVGVIVAVIAIGLGYLLYNNYVSYPKEVEAEKELYFTRKSFEKASKAPENQRDSLYNKVLEGDGNRYGLLQIISLYPSTDAENEAQYLSGMTYLKMRKYNQAIEHLKNFKTEEPIIGALALGGIGDAYADLGENKKAISFYKKAFKKSENEFTSPKFIMKAAITAMTSDDSKQAKTYFEKLKDEYPNFSKSNSVDFFLAKISNAD